MDTKQKDSHDVFFHFNELLHRFHEKIMMLETPLTNGHVIDIVESVIGSDHDRGAVWSHFVEIIDSMKINIIFVKSIQPSKSRKSNFFITLIDPTTYPECVQDWLVPAYEHFFSSTFLN